MLDKMIEVQLAEPDDFLKVKETLTRIGVASFKNKTLYQSCHILHKRGRYYIVHFKELFALDGRQASMAEDDYARRNSIASLLEEWELVKILTPENMTVMAPLSTIKVIGFNDKRNWKLEQKYQIGNK
jgi:hypothetical protein